MHDISYGPRSREAYEVEKLIEYRTVHYGTAFAASRYVTNLRVCVSFRFANPIVCRMVMGYKIMSSISRTLSVPAKRVDFCPVL